MEGYNTEEDHQMNQHRRQYSTGITQRATKVNSPSHDTRAKNSESYVPQANYAPNGVTQYGSQDGLKNQALSHDPKQPSKDTYHTVNAAPPQERPRRYISTSIPEPAYQPIHSNSVQSRYMMPMGLDPDSTRDPYPARPSPMYTPQDTAQKEQNDQSGHLGSPKSTAVRFDDDDAEDHYRKRRGCCCSCWPRCHNFGANLTLCCVSFCTLCMMC